MRSANYTAWTVINNASSKDALPEPTFGLAAGYDDGVAWLLGGYSDIDDVSHQLLSFKDGAFVSHGEYDLNNSYAGYSQQYSQLGQNLFILNQFAQSIDRFDLRALSFDEEYAVVPEMIDEDDFMITEWSSCLATFHGDDGDDYLAVLMGGNSSLEHMLRLSDSTWLSDVAMLNTPRHASACLADNGFLYSIGGLNVTQRPEPLSAGLCCNCLESSEEAGCPSDADCEGHLLRVMFATHAHVPAVACIYRDGVHVLRLQHLLRRRVE